MAYDYKNKEAILAKTNAYCAYCGKDLMHIQYWHRDHVVPRLAGGGNELANLVPACVRCNVRKGCKDVNQFEEWIITKMTKATAVFYDVAQDMVEYLPSDDADFILDRIVEIFNQLDSTRPMFFLDELQKD